MSMRASLQRLSALIYKETMQILRDRRTLFLFFLLPLVQLFLFAYAVSLTVNHLPTALVDQSMDARSRDFVHALESSTYFDIKAVYQNEQEVVRAIDTGQMKAGLIIPPDFAEKVQRGEGDVLILLDGSDSFSVQSGYNAASAIAQKYDLDLVAERVQESLSPLTPVTRVLYNPDIKDLIFILPGLIALIMQNIIVAHSAVAVVREREVGTLEGLLATPMRPIEMVIAKLVPGLVVVTVDMGFILGLGVFWFGVPFQGSLLLLLGLSLLFFISGMSMGLLFSALSHTQRQAQQLSAVLHLLSMLLTGFIYPLATMPIWAQWLGRAIPLTYYIRIIRGIITKGVGIEFLWGDALSLVAYAFVVLLLSSWVMKTRLD